MSHCANICHVGWATNAILGEWVSCHTSNGISKTATLATNPQCLYQYSISYHPGEKIAHPDGLSRLPLSETPISVIHREVVFPKFAILTNHCGPNLTLDQQRSNPVASANSCLKGLEWLPGWWPQSWVQGQTECAVVKQESMIVAWWPI